jgi:hypothetical protein
MSLVNQWEGAVCRTSNFCEGWHGCLKTMFTMSHPELGYFLNEMREELLRHQTQALRILRGRAQIKNREQHVVQTENRVIDAKTDMNAYMLINTYPATGNINVALETLQHYARHQARNCSTQLPVLNFDENNNGNDDSILILN